MPHGTRSVKPSLPTPPGVERHGFAVKCPRLVGAEIDRLGGTASLGTTLGKHLAFLAANEPAKFLLTLAYERRGFA